MGRTWGSTPQGPRHRCVPCDHGGSRFKARAWSPHHTPSGGEVGVTEPRLPFLGTLGPVAGNLEITGHEEIDDHIICFIVT